MEFHQMLEKTSLYLDVNRSVSELLQDKSIIEYMPVIGQPSKYDMCKKYLDDIKKIAQDLELEHIFGHADEDVYARLIEAYIQKSFYTNG